VDRLNAEQPGKANILHFSALHPFPVEATEAALERAGPTVAVEGNSTGQLETLLRARTGRSVEGTIRKYDGRAFTPGYVLAHLPDFGGRPAEEV
jgi:2-oxoglutarate ferredoxin oxidoreductase subunit alpha